MTVLGIRTNKIREGLPGKVIGQRFPSTLCFAPVIPDAISAPPPKPARQALSISRRTSLIVGLLFVIPWLALALVLSPTKSNRSKAARSDVSPAKAAAEPAASVPYDDYVFRCQPGPWGELQYSRISIEPPEEFTAADYAPRRVTRWYFKSYSEEMLAALWSKAELSLEDRGALAAQSTVHSADKSIIVSPPWDLIERLSASSREKIYSVLAAFPENPDQNEPFRFRAENAAEWFENSGLPPATVALVTKLMYRRGNSLLFSDQDLVLTKIASREERVRLMKVLARKSTLLVKLLVKPDTDAEALAQYWGRGIRHKALRPFIQSLSHRPRGMTVDISHLLPRFARSRVFTYPEASDHAGDADHDCHWSSLNFFNDPADEKYADAEIVKRTLEEEYYMPTEGTPLLGDILVFKRADGAVIHSCVYVADEIVFTKNGSSAMMPWMLMTLRDVIAFYPAEPALTVQAFRLKGIDRTEPRPSLPAARAPDRTADTPRAP